ncbi:CAP superfamily protein [Abeliophyllum distichum]|uniref:CAP superfamily protein n=1 Tax=Abeliophyllum distichum TaxID=126358 RepID=A0ABD1RR37_9LAMI
MSSSRTNSILIFYPLIALTLFAHFSISQNTPQDFLDAHNKARAEVGVQPLVWNHTVADYALNYAHKRYGDCNLEHSQGPYGENLAEGWGKLSSVDAVNMWVGEKSCYDYRVKFLRWRRMPTLYAGGLARINSSWLC